MDEKNGQGFTAIRVGSPVGMDALVVSPVAWDLEVSCRLFPVHFLVEGFKADAVWLNLEIFLLEMKNFIDSASTQVQ